MEREGEGDRETGRSGDGDSGEEGEGKREEGEERRGRREGEGEGKRTRLFLCNTALPQDSCQ